LTEAYQWFALAAAQGDKEAGAMREEIAAQLDPPELAAAQKAVSNFRATPQPKEAVLVPAPAGGWDSTDDTRPSQHKLPSASPVMVDAFKIGER
jgi:localization factor PodJL